MMSRYGVVTVGRLAIRESYSVSEGNTDGTRTLTMAGQESSPYVSQADMNRRREDILNSRGRFVPVTFSQKEELNGYYFVTSASADWTHWDDHQLGALPWTMELMLVGSSSVLDLESKLGGSLTRLNDHSVVTAERWNAPPIGHTNYYSGSTIATMVDRPSTDGTIKVYRSIALNVNPQWSCSELNYMLGRCRFIDINGKERTGESFVTTAAGWEINNGLVRVRPLASGGVLEVSHWLGGVWVAKNWDVLLTGVSFGAMTDVSLLRNEPEMLVLRLIKSLSGIRRTIDITIRRGSRMAMLYVQTATAGEIRVGRSSIEAGTSGTGYVTATTGTHRYLIGSARSFSPDLVNGGIGKLATVTMDVVLGMVVNAAAPLSGDAAVDIFKQYLGTPSESVGGVLR